MTNKAADIKSDTLTLLICNQVHRFKDIKTRAIKISKCCKIIRDRTKDEVLYRACRNVISAVSNGKYIEAVNAINQTETNYYLGYK